MEKCWSTSAATFLFISYFFSLAMGDATTRHLSPCKKGGSSHGRYIPPTLRLNKISRPRLSPRSPKNKESLLLLHQLSFCVPMSLVSPVYI
jgi:hypothetical protein